MASARRRARDARDACLQSRRGAACVASGAGMALSGVLVAAPLANAASRTVAEAPRGGPMAVSASGYCFEARRGLREIDQKCLKRRRMRCRRLHVYSTDPMRPHGHLFGGD